MWDDLKNMLGDIAPTIATALGGPLAGGAVGLLEGALGLKNATVDDIKKAVTHADPAFALELQKLSMGDRADARAMQIATKSKTTGYLSFNNVDKLLRRVFTGISTAFPRWFWP